MIEWKGIFPALTTPFDAQDALDLATFERSLDAQIAAGVHGVIIGGSLGEASTLTNEEKEALVRSALKKSTQNIPVVLNIAETSTRQALQQVTLAEKWKADGLMLLPPMRYRSDARETVEFFKTLANSTNLPIMIYNNPVDYGIEVTLDMFDEMTACTNIEAVKESTRDVTNVTRMKNRFGNRFKILCGADTLAMEELLLGAEGGVAGLVNAFPGETVALYNLVHDRYIEEATQIYRWFMPLLELDIHPKLVQYIKLAQDRTGLGTEYVRPPRLRLIGEERERILRVIEQGISKRPLLPRAEPKQKSGLYA